MNKRDQEKAEKGRDQTFNHLFGGAMQERFMDTIFANPNSEDPEADSQKPALKKEPAPTKEQLKPQEQLPNNGQSTELADRPIFSILKELDSNFTSLGFLMFFRGITDREGTVSLTGLEAQTGITRLSFRQKLNLLEKKGFLEILSRDRSGVRFRWTDKMPSISKPLKE